MNPAVAEVPARWTALLEWMRAHSRFWSGGCRHASVIDCVDEWLKAHPRTVPEAR